MPVTHKEIEEYVINYALLGFSPEKGTVVGVTPKGYKDWSMAQFNAHKSISEGNLKIEDAPAGVNDTYILTMCGSVDSLSNGKIEKIYVYWIPKHIDAEKAFPVSDLSFLLLP